MTEVYKYFRLEKLKDMEFQPVKVKGKFDHSREILFGPRPLVVNNDANTSSSSLLSKPKVGYWIITPFKLSDRK